MRSITLVVVGILTFSAFASADEATPEARCDKRVRVYEQTKYYDVVGKTTASVRNDLAESRPHRDDAKTDWRVGWSFNYEQSETGYRITQASVSVHIEHSMPRLVNSPEQTNRLRRQWTGFIASLEEHAKGHRQIAIAAGTRIQHQMLSLEELPTLADLRTAVRTMNQSTLDEYSALEVQYDRKTDFGRSQGAVFPQLAKRSSLSPNLPQIPENRYYLVKGTASSAK